MANAHSAIDSLIANATLQRFQKGGQVPQQSIEDILMENQKLNFVQRILNPELNVGREHYYEGETKPSTHFMFQYDNRVAPAIVDTGGTMLTPLGDDEAISYADSTGEYIKFKTPAEALWFSKNYKDYWKKLKKNPYKQYQEGGQVKKKMPWYTKALLSSLGDGQAFYQYDEEGYPVRSSANWRPEDVERAYSMISDELGFEPRMVKRMNILRKALPSEMMQYIKTGDVSSELQGLRKNLLNMYFEGGEKQKEPLAKSLVGYAEKYDLYTPEGQQFAKRLVDSGLINEDALIKLYQYKYEKLYSNKQ